jgi:uncharacterized integral membrane protein
VFVAALILLIVVVLLVIAALFGGNDPTTVDLGAFKVDGPVALFFFAGAVTLLLLVISLAMFRGAARRSAARRADRTKVSELSTKLDEYQREERETGHDSTD